MTGLPGGQLYNHRCVDSRSATSQILSETALCLLTFQAILKRTEPGSQGQASAERALKDVSKVTACINQFYHTGSVTLSIHVLSVRILKLFFYNHFGVTQFFTTRISFSYACYWSVDSGGMQSWGWQDEANGRDGAHCKQNRIWVQGEYEALHNLLLANECCYKVLKNQ